MLRTVLNLPSFRSLAPLFPACYHISPIHKALDEILTKPEDFHFHKEKWYCHAAWEWLSEFNKEQVITKLTPSEQALLTEHNTFRRLYKTPLKIEFFYDVYKQHWKYHVMSGDKDTANKKNNINVKREKWTAEDSEGEEGDYTDWKLFDPSPATIKNLWNRALNRNLKTASFHKGEYKMIFPRWVTLSDTAFSLLIEAGIVNDTLNKNWPLDYNSEGWAFTRPNHTAHGNLGVAPDNGVYAYGTQVLTRKLSIVTGYLTPLVKGSVTPSARGGNPKPSPAGTPTKRTPGTRTHAMLRKLSMLKAKGKKKDATPLGSEQDMQEVQLNEGEGPVLGNISPLSDHHESDASPPTLDEHIHTTKKIQAVTTVAERQDRAILRQAKMFSRALWFTKDQLKVNNVKTLHANIKTWRETFKASQQTEINAHNELIKSLDQFPATVKRIFTHGKNISDLLQGFANWLDQEHVSDNEGDIFSTHKVNPGRKRKRQDIEEDEDIDEDEWAQRAVKKLGSCVGRQRVLFFCPLELQDKAAGEGRGAWCNEAPHWGAFLTGNGRSLG